MHQSVDPRIQERRRKVQANRSRSSARRLVWILAIVATLAAGAWIVQSPALAVNELVIDGATRTPVERLLADAGVENGDPLLLVDTAAAEQTLRTSAWVADVAVRKVFPNTLEVIVLEKVAVAIVEHRSGAVAVAVDGTILGAATDLDISPSGKVLASVAPGAVGELITDPLDRAGVKFLGVWQGPFAVISKIDGDLWAELDGYTVRLGGPTEMDQKARSLEAVLLEGQPTGSMINVIAPTRPTVLPPDGVTAPVSTEP